MDLGITQILNFLPHRYPFLLLDCAKNIVPGEKGVGIKNITINEPYFQGHFPDNPIMPGVLQVEAMAQTAGLVVLTQIQKTEKEKVEVLFATVDKVRFRKPVIPGDQIEFHVQKINQVKNVYKFEGRAYVGGNLVSQAVFSALILNKKGEK